jgi:hypothetical protein
VGWASIVLLDGRVWQVPFPVTAAELMLEAPGNFLTNVHVARASRSKPFCFAVGAGVVATSARLTEVCSMMHSADPVVALSEATSARAVVGAAVAEGCNWLGGGGGSGAHSAVGGAGDGDVEELDAEGLGHAARG